MKVRVRLFASLRDQANAEAFVLDLPGGPAASAAVAEIEKRFPTLKSILARSALAVNQCYVKADHVLNDGDEIALIPPVSGG